MTAAKQNVKNVVWNFPPMTALNGIRKRRTPNHQDHRTRKTPGELRKRETQKTEMLVLADILSRNMFLLVVEPNNPDICA